MGNAGAEESNDGHDGEEGSDISTDQNPDNLTSNSEAGKHPRYVDGPMGWPLAAI